MPKLFGGILFKSSTHVLLEMVAVDEHELSPRDFDRRLQRRGCRCHGVGTARKHQGRHLNPAHEVYRVEEGHLQEDA